jgi:Protein of unknown function (DUF2934)
MTSKRSNKTDTLSAGGTVRRSRSSGVTHSRKPGATVASSSETESIDIASQVDTEAVARLAYSYWEARGGVGGTPEDDWFRAEHELVTLNRSLENA